MIRPAKEGDAPAVAALLNAVVLETTISFRHEAWSAEEVAARMAHLRGAGREYFVALALAGGAVVGHASYDQFRGGSGYRTAMEHSVALSPAARGRGLGRALVEAVASHAAERGARTLWAGVSGENPEGEGFHRACGFERIARLPGPGFKFGRSLDLVLMRRALA
ncbi:phosphinothricin acetyltransferase [Hasllibacter halocynthiae]|uniref:Phosphinothricin acetyltransferase n=1 Tax=Hasllibacter halocynthiae TaxID=595589 RepID=A0A2T0X6T5_9RHOB|nr:GNAT family N-acetyltransferase [Hasllibacter halocynthiae]PRY94584.1 phosphinothricin acetyltransferase [Hasllibacter halocynthiae]